MLLLEQPELGQGFLALPLLSTSHPAESSGSAQHLTPGPQPFLWRGVPAQLSAHRHVGTYS